ncbi:C1 family peptidase [uncultured Mucilaginibacter sp.]|uniref:C1 family peptidase n=1 Tax=uncultured Mucilaginibacter sp. TaxID=797541 RepID=UPI0025F422A6|nr:C1 family peptidase [uncultured Mucilaginibacter sp.]
MKRLIIAIVAVSFACVFLNSCKKSTNVVNPGTSPVTTNNLHGFGLNAMTPQDLANVPSFSSSLFSNRLQPDGLTYNGTAYNSYLLVTPQIRDQGQLGACTGFCGAETDEILYYYKNNSVQPIANFTIANGIVLATQNEIPNTSEESYYGSGNTTAAAVSPLFLYFVERVVISGGSIGSDPGANMVNIGETLQGLSNNSGSGKALTYNGYTFDGISNESLYKYPFVLGSGGYNVATATTAPYTTYPYNYFNYGTNIIPVAPNNFPIGTQSGSTSSSGTTTEGYYVITDTKAALIADVKTALLNNKPVMMGFNVYDKGPSYSYFESLSTTSYTYNPLTSSGSLVSGIRLQGGHAVPIVGYINDSTQPGGGVFICQNSWGTPWGYHGYFYLPYSVITNTKIVPASNLFVAII